MLTFANEHVVTNHKDAKILDVLWSKQNGYTVEDFKKYLKQNENIRRGELKAMASICDRSGSNY